MPRAVYCVILLTAVLWNSQSHAGISSVLTKWPNGKDITVCFFGGTLETRTAIARIAQEWTGDLGVHFAFGKPDGYNSCVPDQSYDVRVGFGAPGSWAYLGKDALHVPQDRPTVNFSEQKEEVSSASARTEILHEFGHVLGMLNQEQDPKFCQTELNKDYLRSIGLSDDDLKQSFSPPGNDGQTVPDNGQFFSTALDIASVMRMFTRPEFFKNGVDSPCYGPPVDRPSAEDLRLARLLYPPKPTEVSAIEPGHITIQFDGLLAAEHFGYVVDALYAAGAIQLKKHVLVVDETIDEVIARENLAPRGVTSRSLDDFLCRVNGHICVVGKERNIWKGTSASKNYVDQGLKCGDQKLPKFVVCIPNVRLEKYMTITDFSINAKKQSLGNIVVKKFHSCDVWNDSCRALVADINKGTTVSDSDQLFSPNYVGQVLLPIVGYRLVVEYSDNEQRDRIEKAVREVANSRARQLGISSSSVSIDVTYPLGSPKLHGAAAGMSGSTWRQVEGYPDDEPTTRQNLGPDKVDAAIWDLHVDSAHCELKDLVYATPSTSSAGTPPLPPDPTPTCATVRGSDYVLSQAYDHATAVAGVISAVLVNNAGIAGVAPGTRVWSWEVVSGNQFNIGDNPLILQRTQYPFLRPVAVNISQSYPILEPGKKTNLEIYLFGDRQHNIRLDQWSLFVAAAGDVNGDGVLIDSTQAASCPIYPACWSNGPGEAPRGIISVVALDAKGNSLLRDASGKTLSNYGRAFDVAAIGDTVTTLHGNWVGPARGSSFAAPYVTGLAVLLFAKTKSEFHQAQVQDVKNRILFTTDEPQEIVGFSRFGRINFTKALNYEDDWIRYEPSGECPDDPCWRKIRVDRSKSAFLTVTGMLEGGENFSKKISYKDLKSVRRTDDASFTVFFMEGDRLKRVNEAQIVADNNKIVQIGPDFFLLKLEHVLEYVSCSWCDS